MDKEKVKDIIKYLKKALITSNINAEYIALFGSYLNNTATEESDLDLIIISSDFENKDIFERAELTQKPEIGTLKKFMVPMDILNLTPEEYKESQKNGFYKSRIVA